VTAILDSLRLLDARLRRVADAARAATGREPGADPFRGLYLSEADFRESLKRENHDVPALGSTPLATGDAFTALGPMYGLSQFEMDTLLLALAPEVDPQYERIFGYLQDDVSRRRPSVDLVLALLCDSAEDRLAKRAALTGSGELVRQRLVRLSGDHWVPLPRREICIDARVAAFLLGDGSVDPRLAGLVTLVDPAAVVRDSQNAGLASLVRQASLVYFRGADEEAKRRAAAALASEFESALLIGETGRASRRGDFEDWLDHLAREARLRRAVVYHAGVDALDETAKESVVRAFPECAVILSGTQEWKASAEAVTVPFDTPSWRERRRAWEAALRKQGMEAAEASLDTLAEAFKFNRGQIAQTTASAVRVASFRSEPARVTHVFEAARERSGNEMSNLARRVPVARGWDDLILPAPHVEQLREICHRVALRHRVLDEWGFGRRLSGGKGVNALFHGHSGTGKTMAAEVIARELELDLYKIDLAGVVSKYIGETEKNLERVFSTAENANVILLFDEADALFGKRSEVRDSHDRYANLEVSYLLQKMEAYEGLSILATNLRQNLDEAFLRRLAFIVPFPFPDEASRRRIWHGIWPKSMPLDPSVNNDGLGDRFLLSGGNIRNVAVGAAYLAAEESNVVNMTHVLRAVRSEFSKMGKSMTAAELALPQSAVNGALAGTIGAGAIA
jgi:ATPase family associated with various cellular activities (AAA)